MNDIQETLRLPMKEANEARKEWHALSDQLAEAFAADPRDKVRVNGLVVLTEKARVRYIENCADVFLVLRAQCPELLEG